MRFAFVQSTWSEYPGTMYLAGVLKSRGHAVDCFISSGEQDLVGAISAWKPDMLGFSLTSGEIDWARKTIALLKSKLKIPVVLGGPHPTFFPEVLQEEELVDFICVGEGEDAIRELVEAVENGTSVESIAGIGYKKGSSTRINPPRPLIRDFDQYPPSDRKLYKRYDALYRNSLKHILAGRGCPYDCSFCHNHLYFAIYGRNIFRLPSHERVLEEVESVVREVTTTLIDFCDDTFSANPAWLISFLEKYRRRFNIPFICSIHVHSLSEEICRALARAGCFRICVGVESGSERVRREILGKRFTDDELLKAAEMIHRNGMKLLTNNMMGIPTETVEEAWQTVDLNIRMKVDFPWCSILQPYPRTKVAEIAHQKGLMDADSGKFPPTFFWGSMIRQKNIPELVRIQKLFWFALKFPRMRPLWKLLSRLPVTQFLHVLFLISFALRYMAANKISFRYILTFAWQNRNLYIKPA